MKPRVAFGSLTGDWEDRLHSCTQGTLKLDHAGKRERGEVHCCAAWEMTTENLGAGIRGLNHALPPRHAGLKFDAARRYMNVNAFVCFEHA
jgi:hypothetical protein